VSGGIDTNAMSVAAKYRRAGVLIRQALEQELDALSARAAAAMKLKAPKFQSTLTNSIRVDRESRFARFIGPHTAYAINVEKGRRPGKGLPRFFDPAAASAKAWLQAQINAPLLAANPKRRNPRVGSKRMQAEQTELRDRYMAFSRHVKFKGLKPHPYVQPVVDDFRGIAPQSLAAAVKRGAQAAGFGVA
jgi:hypothetical protein